MKYGIDSTVLQAEWMDTSVGEYDTCVRAYYDIGSGNLTKAPRRPTGSKGLRSVASDFWQPCLQW